MFLKFIRLAVSLATLLAVSTPLWADTTRGGLPLFSRDPSYEQALRFEASADKTITPAKVLRWLLHLTGSHMTIRPSNTEFQPIVNVYNTRVRLIAAIAYKF